MALGTAVTALGFIALGLACGVVALILLLLLAGAGSGAQHPLCASLVSKAYYGGPQRTALGIYNFSGDIGKMAVPLIAALIITELDWCASTVGYGTVGLLAALAVLLILTRCARVDAPVLTPDLATSEVHVGWGIRNPRGFGVLILIGMLDSASRTEFLTFLPFLLIAKGADVETVRLALALVFGGGAAGKFICGFLAERLGVVRTVILTELITYGGIVLLLPLPLEAALVLLPLVGLGLNGTSSVLYGSIAESFVPERRFPGLWTVLHPGDRRWGGVTIPIRISGRSDRRRTGAGDHRRTGVVHRASGIPALREFAHRKSGRLSIFAYPALFRQQITYLPMIHHIFRRFEHAGVPPCFAGQGHNLHLVVKIQRSLRR